MINQKQIEKDNPKHTPQQMQIPIFPKNKKLNATQKY